MNAYISEIEDYLNTLNIPFYRQDALFSFVGKQTRILAVSLTDAADKDYVRSLLTQRLTSPLMLLYQDRWKSDEMIKKRILAHLGFFNSVFARKCDVVRIDPSQANDFLNKYHNYGGAKSKYKYALKYNGSIVAVSLFSGSRLVERIIDGQSTPLRSFEWIRYASLPDIRVVGGMGKMLDAFIKEHSPQEIMSYSDNEWSSGEVYYKLGFSKVSQTEQIEFYVNNNDFTRISSKAIARNRVDNDSIKLGINNGDYSIIWNAGSSKWLKQI